MDWRLFGELGQLCGLLLGWGLVLQYAERACTACWAALAAITSVICRELVALMGGLRFHMLVL